MFQTAERAAMPATLRFALPSDNFSTGNTFEAKVRIRAASK
jgi:hypothetical protein